MAYFLSVVCCAPLVNRPVEGIRELPPIYQGFEISDDEDSFTDAETTASLDPDVLDALNLDLDDDTVYGSDDHIRKSCISNWLGMVRNVLEHELDAESRARLVEKYDELEEFFYILISEFFAREGRVSDIIDGKRQEFIHNWEGEIGIGTCERVFDFLATTMERANPERDSST